MDEKLERALEHLRRMIGVAQLPTDQWNRDDWRVLRDARQFVQTYQEKDESEGSEKGPEDAGATPSVESED